MRVCSTPTCPVLVSASGRCASCMREADRTRGSRHERGYDSAHVATRAACIEDAYGTQCRYCGERMWPHQHLVLDHTADRTGYRGIVHADYRDCTAGGNAAEGATRGNQLRTTRGV